LYSSIDALMVPVIDGFSLQIILSRLTLFRQLVANYQNEKE